jgi:hypothetical protein
MRLTSHLLVALVASLALSAAALVVAAAASAKELKSPQVCGLDETCAPMRDRGAVESITNFSSPSKPPPTAPYYRLDFVYESPDGRDHNAFSHLFVPSRNLIAAGGEVEGTIVWFAVTGDGLALIRRSMTNLNPFAAPANWPKSIDDPMFRPGRPKPAQSGGRDWTPWLVGLGAVLLALGAAAVLARRLRLRHAMAANLLLTILVAFVVAAAASAKTLTSAQLCGADECAPLNDRQSVMTILGGSGWQPPPTDAYYRFDVTFETMTHSYLYVPSAGLVAAEGPVGDVVWYPARGDARDMLAQAGRDLEPFAAPAKWPTAFADPIFTHSSPTPSVESRNWTPWLVAAAILLVTLAAAAFLARRLVALRLSQET